MSVEVQCKIDKRLNVLREIVHNLPPAPPLQTVGDVRSYVVVKTETGRSWMSGVIQREEIGIVDSFGLKGTICGRHQHKGHHWILLYKGGPIEVEINGESETYQAPCMVYIPPEMPHKVSYLHNAWTVGITSPADEAFLKGQ